METNDPQNPENTNNPDPKEQQDGPSKPLTVTVPDALLKRLRVVAVLREQTISEVVVSYVSSQVRRDLKKLSSKLDV